MKRLSAVTMFAGLGLALLSIQLLGRDNATLPHGLPARVPWTASRITGSPEPPHPYRVERVFPKLSFKNPLLIRCAPGTNRFFVGEHAGKLFSFPKDPSCSRADPCFDLTTELQSWDQGKIKGVGAVYALAFHPQFVKNRYCYICYVLDSKTWGEQLPNGTRVSRFRMTDTDPPRVDPKSEKVLITWLAGGHNGCDMHFGNDGFLYISTGDGAAPNPPDVLDTGQDLSDLLSSVLRIDVDREDKGKAYAIPPDNPFVTTPKARPEIWAYGFRNPWRMSFDRPTGDLWVGDVGWELWEMVYRVKKGGNYGWSVMEGRQPVRPAGKRGPTPILPPTLDFPHTEAASITGGYVYHGKQLKDLVGEYVCGDWVTRKLWATRFDGDKIVSHKEIAQGNQRVVAFAEDHDGELYFLHYDENGSIHQLVPNEAAREHSGSFPRKLSETGLFASVKDHLPAPGVVPFSVNAAQWADHATAERFVALPGKTTARVYDGRVTPSGEFFSGEVFFPKDGVLARTVSLEMERGNPRSRRQLETQVLHFDGTAWRGYSYEWNDEQTDAALVPASGKDRALVVTDTPAPGGKRKQTWHFPSRTECLTCHNPWAGPPLAFTLPQLNRDRDYNGVVDNQLRALRHIGLISLLRQDEFGQTTTLTEPPPARLTDPCSAADLNERARSYLQVNCAHCHQFGAGGSALIDLRYTAALEDTKALEVAPVQGTFGIQGALLLAPGDPYRSVLYYRMAKLGGGRMPHLGSEIVDERGLRLMHDWIRQLPVRKDERVLLERLRALDEPAVLAQEAAERAIRLKRIALGIARNQNRQAIAPDDQKKAEAQDITDAAARVKQRATERTDTIGRLLGSSIGAAMLAHALGEDRIPTSVRPQVLTAAAANSEAPVRDLFERFLPDEQRTKRLGTAIKPEQILALKGNVERGRKLFFDSATLQCAKCHRVAGTGGTLGPDLSQVAKKSTRPQILESLLEPSKVIDPQYVSYLAETKDGQVHSGLLVRKDGREVVLRTADDKEIRLPVAKVAGLAPLKTSLMPEQALRDLTAEQAADLLEFLTSLK